MAITSGSISRNNIIEVGYEEIDIGGTDLATASGDEGWRRLGQGQEFMAYVFVNEFDASDKLDVIRLEEAKDTSGLDSQIIAGKSLTLFASGVTAGKVFILEVKASELTEDFGYVRLFASEALNTGVDEITVIYVRTKGGDLTTADARI